MFQQVLIQKFSSEINPVTQSHMITADWTFIPDAIPKFLQVALNAEERI